MVSGSGFGVKDFEVEGLGVHGFGKTLVWGQASGVRVHGSGVRVPRDSGVRVPQPML
jgi:hypothetical protein